MRPAHDALPNLSASRAIAFIRSECSAKSTLAAGLMNQAEQLTISCRFCALSPHAYGAFRIEMHFHAPSL